MDSNTEKSEENPDVSSSSKKEVSSSLQKVCLVCGDKALGYNFNAISCESCKAFFRRNALTNKEFKCPFTNKCEINVVTRRFCQKCRMVKCLAVGMVKEFIMSEEDKAKKRRKIEENRAKKRRSEPRDLGSQSKSLKREDEISNTSKEDSNSAFKESCHNSYRDENTNAYVDSNSNPYTEGASNNTPAAYNNSKSYQDNIKAYKQENTVNSFREDESNMFHTESSTPYREITVKNREDSCFSFKDNTVPYKDDISTLFRDDTSSFKPDSSMPYQEGNINKYPTQMTDSAVQYDLLNSTSPSSSVQSPSSNDIDSSVHSSPLYNPYSSARSSDIPYPKRGFHVEDNGVVNRAVYRIDSFRTEAGNGMYPERKQISIRSILTNGDIGRPVVCDRTPTPSTSSETDINKAKEILQDVERIEPNSMESILCEAIKLEFEAYTSVIPCASSRELNEVERAKLNELIVANKALHAPIDQDMSVLIEETPASVGIKEDASGGHDPRLVKIVNLTAVAIRRFIKMVKKINAFRNMCEEDQIALLKGGCIEMLVLRSAMQYDGQRNTWKVPHSQEEYGTIRTDVLKLAKGNIYTKHDAFIRSFDQRWRCDEHIILVMSAILLFTPDRAKVVHRDVVKLEQNSYYYLLRRYLESVYPGCEAKSTFLKLIQKILELRKLAEEVTEVYLDVNPIEPLLMEIFDLKHHAA